MHLPIPPIFPLNERNRDAATLLVHKPVDSKVRGVVLERMGQTRGALLSSAMAPQIVTFLFPEAKGGKQAEWKHKKQKHRLRKAPWSRKAPIGLMPVDSEGWVNALLQFILYVPGFAEAFAIAPRTLFPIQECIDQYHHDVAEGKGVSAAGSHLYRLFAIHFPQHSLCEVAASLMRLLMPQWTIYHSLTEAMSQPRLADLFLAAGHLQKQIHTQQYYDLDVFIEKRPDGARAHYVTYVKVEGCWYQCDNDRITQLRSDLLTLPLQCAILAHYRQVHIGAVLDRR